VKYIIEMTLFHLNKNAMWHLITLMQNQRENEDAYSFNHIVHQTPG